MLTFFLIKKSLLRVVILLDLEHLPQMGYSLKALKFKRIKKNLLGTSKMKEKKVNYLQMEILRRITLQFTEKVVWKQRIKDRMVV